MVWRWVVKMDIEIQDLTHTYPNGAAALRGVSLEIRAGAQIALLGQNGAGKTTLVKHLNGLLKPTRGRVRIGDWDTRAHSIAQLARRVGFVFQNPDEQLFKTRVVDEIAVGPTNLKFARAEIETRVARALRVCELDAVRDAHPYDLSPSQRRWVAIASVVAMETPVVVLDEPTTGQDARGLARLTRLLDMWRAQKVTVIAVTHDVDFAIENFSELCLMSEGQVLARGDAAVFDDVSAVARAALDVPQLMRLANALGWRERVVRAQEFCAVYARRRGRA